ncbi:hypothetical protein KIN20_017136 [Parelaphostrongylus tenuis]|uniref:Uncharacterized protein n=1 Tax=Parelaphostrongylus tenuis TaxID=148309 RepID=A0AAD5MZK0_PARTN|nr:hypothetical protein KIN20_017136 [Parelaphostrongylus tenuis]
MRWCLRKQIHLSVDREVRKDSLKSSLRSKLSHLTQRISRRKALRTRRGSGCSPHLANGLPLASGEERRSRIRAHVQERFGVVQNPPVDGDDKSIVVRRHIQMCG